jgi:hypothetical protein
LPTPLCHSPCNACPLLLLLLLVLVLVVLLVWNCVLLNPLSSAHIYRGVNVFPIKQAVGEWVVIHNASFLQTVLLLTTNVTQSPEPIIFIGCRHMGSCRRTVDR